MSTKHQEILKEVKPKLTHILKPRINYNNKELIVSINNNLILKLVTQLFNRELLEVNEDTLTQAIELLVKGEATPVYDRVNEPLVKDKVLLTYCVSLLNGNYLPLPLAALTDTLISVEFKRFPDEIGKLTVDELKEKYGLFVGVYKLRLIDTLRI